jgi:hypothetical protein
MLQKEEASELRQQLSVLQFTMRAMEARMAAQSMNIDQ